MTREESFFIQVLSDHLAGQKTEPVQDLNWKSIMQLSRMHQVDGMIYYQCKSFLPVDIRKHYEKISGSTVFRFYNHKIIIKQTEAAFQKEQIPYSVIKGFPVAQLYPVPALRTMGDCDIIVQSSFVSDADKVLVQNGYERISTYMQHEWTYGKNDYLLELHDVLVREDEYLTAAQEKFFNGFSAYINDNELDWNFHFLFLLMHLRKHLIKSGVGIRQFMDLAVVIKEKELNWDWIEKKLAQLHLDKFAHACYDLIYAWFGITIDEHYEHLNSGFIDKITQRILMNGVFGFADSKNDNNIEKNAIVMGRVPRWANRMKALFFSVFLPYRYMRRYPGFQYVNKKPYLMPIAWVHRFGKLLIRKDKSSSIHTLQKYFIEKQELDEREEFLSKMGMK